MNGARLLRLLASLCLLGACGKTEGDDDIKPVASVTTAPVATGPAVRTVAAYGAAEFSPDSERSITAPVEASLENILAPAGTTVAAGQVVAILRPTPTSALDLNKAKSDAAAADTAQARAQRLRAAGLASDAEVETARAAALAADATAASLTARSGGALALRAPVAGVVETLAVEAGGVAVQGAVVAKIGELSGLRIRLGVDPAKAVGLRAGLAVRLAPVSGGVASDGVVVAVDPRLDPQTRLAAVYVRVPPGGFAPGEPVEGQIVLGQRPGAMLIPRAALIYDGNQPYVFIARGGAGRRRDVTVGVDSGDLIEITGGLVAGERVVVDGAAALEDGMAIREAPPAAPAGGQDQ